MKERKHYQGASGFTVMELIVGIAIAAILMGIAVPSLMSLLPTLRLSSAARQIATDLQVARMKAISQNAQNTVTFNVANGTYAFTFGSISRNLDTLYPGIRIQSVTSNPIFTPRGTTQSAVTIAITNGSAQKLVCVKTVGRVNIQDSSCT